MYRVLISAVVLTFLACSALAGEGTWRVGRVSGQVQYSVDKTTWKAAERGETIPDQAWISTGRRGRAQLVRGVESITLQPNTLAGLYAKGGLFTPKTEIVQQAGIIDQEIEKRSRPHTTVETPFLAAVVKGTAFRVTVTKRAANVSVNRGVVQVTSFKTGERTSLRHGQSASVDVARGMKVSGTVSKPTITVERPSVAKIPALGTKELVGASAQGPDAVGRLNGRKGANGESASKESGKSAKGSEKSAAGKGNAGKGSSSNGGHSGKGNSGHGNGNSGASGKGNSGNSGHGNGNSGASGKGNSGNSGHGNGNSGHGNGNSGNSGHGNGNGGKGRGH
jgi:hypothetical protein